MTWRKYQPHGEPMVNHGGVIVGLKTAKRWRAIEEEYEEPIRDVLNGYRGDGLSWGDIADILEVNRTSLQRWRKWWRIDKGERPKRIARKPLPSDIRAKALGYVSITEAILDLRLNQKMTTAKTAAFLGVAESTIYTHRPESIHGLVHHNYERRGGRVSKTRPRAYAGLKADLGGYVSTPGAVTEEWRKRYMTDWRPIIEEQKPRLAHCSAPTCGALIVWVTSPATGKKVCLDAEGDNIYQSHWRTCKDRERFRR